MKVYCQFKVMSAGYVPNSLPPKYSDEYKKPVDKLGSDGVYILDGRNTLTNSIQHCIDRAKKLGGKIVGFDIVKSNRFSDNGTVVYSHSF